MHQGQLSPIDFGNALFGYYLWDIVSTFDTPAFNTPEYRPRYRAYFAGYQEVRPLPADYQITIQAMFTYWRISETYGEIIHNPAAKPIVTHFKLPPALWLAERFVEEHPFPEI